MPARTTRLGSPRKKSKPPTKIDPACVHQVKKWILEGHAEHDIAEAGGAAWPKQKIEPLIVAAIEQIRVAGNFDPSLVRGWCFEAYRDLYRRLLEIGDYVGALRALNQILKMAQNTPDATPTEEEPSE